MKHVFTTYYKFLLVTERFYYKNLYETGHRRDKQ